MSPKERRTLWERVVANSKVLPDYLILHLANLPLAGRHGVGRSKALVKLSKAQRAIAQREARSRGLID